MGIFSEFRTFAMRGSVVDLAVGVVIGAAFGRIVTALVDNVVMPVVGLLVAGADFKDLGVTLKDAVVANGAVVEPAVVLKYGAFVQAVVDFAIVAFVIFLAVKAINRLAARRAEDPPKPAEPSSEVKLLTEIRDALTANRPA